MKIYISSDMEGTTGIVNWQETELGNKLYDHFSEQMSKEVAAACRQIPSSPVTQSNGTLK